MAGEIPGKSPESLRSPKSEFLSMLEARWSDGQFVCVGLDTDLSKIPPDLRDYYAGVPFPQMRRFNLEIIDATHAFASAYKPNSAFYEAQGEEGIRALKSTISYIKEKHPEIPVILDAKRADIGNTNNGYIEFAFDELDADAITVHPYLGMEAMKPFLERDDKGIIVLVRTSNPGAGEYQDLQIGTEQTPLYQLVARNVAHKWNYNGNCGVVVGATYPEELKKVREIVGDMPILIPGIGAQGGDLEATVRNGHNSQGQGMIINSSRGIIFASSGPDFAQAAGEEAKKLNSGILNALKAL